MADIQTQQSAMDRLFEMLEKGYSKQQEQSDNYLDIAKNTAAERSKWMEMLMAEHRNKQSANPFIALLDGYIGMKKRKSPDYEWRGLATTVPEAIGGLLGRTGRTKTMNGPVEYDPLRKPGDWLMGGE